MNFTSQSIDATYKHVLNVDSGSYVFNGTGSRIVNVDLTASYSNTASYFSPSKGSVTNAGALTGSATFTTGYGFVSETEFNAFIVSVSSSLQQFNSLLDKLRSAGIIT